MEFLTVYKRINSLSWLVSKYSDSNKDLTSFPPSFVTTKILIFSVRSPSFLSSAFTSFLGFNCSSFLIMSLLAVPSSPRTPDNSGLPCFWKNSLDMIGILYNAVCFQLWIDCISYQENCSKSCCYQYNDPSVIFNDLLHLILLTQYTADRVKKGCSKPGGSR